MHNKIARIKLDMGEKIETREDMEKELTTFYKNILSELDNHRSEAISKVLETIPSLITEDHNKALMRPIEEKEVEDEIT